MKTVKLKEAALIAEIIGGLAVVLSLIFVGYQVKQSSDETALNTRNIAVAAYQDLMKQIMEINFNSMNNPELRIAMRNDDNGAELTEDQETLVALHYLNTFRHGDMAYYQYEQGLIDESRLKSALGILVVNIAARDSMKRHWNRVSSYSSAYKDYVNLLVRDSEQDRRSSR